MGLKLQGVGLDHLRCKRWQMLTLPELDGPLYVQTALTHRADELQGHPSHAWLEQLFQPNHG